VIGRTKVKSSERLETLLKGDKPDRVPHISFVLGFCAKNVGCSLAAIYDDPETSFRAQQDTRAQYGYDSEPFYGYASYGGWEFGGRIRLPDGEYAQAPANWRLAVSSENDVESLQTPDINVAGILPRAMRFSRLQVKSGLNPSLVIAGPFTVAGNICGAEKLCRWLIKAPELAHRLLRIATDHLADTVRHWVKAFGAGVVAVQIWEPLATNQVISSRQFESFVFPYQMELHQKILSAGIRYLLCHICGDQNLNLPLWRQIPMGESGIVSIGKEVALKDAIACFGKTTIIAGNLDPSLIQTGTPRQIYEACQEAIQTGITSPRGYAFMEGCEVPVNTPSYNYYTIRKAICEFDQY
jgi:uroporphyrinogen decarboxylase